MEYAPEDHTTVTNERSESPFFDNNFVKAELLMPMEERRSFFEIPQSATPVSSSHPKKSRKQKVKTGARRNARKICMNPLDESLAEDSLAILHAFEELWVYMPLDPELPLEPADSEGLDEEEKKVYAMLTAVTNNIKKCQFYGNQLSLCVKRVNEIREAQRLAALEGKTAPDLPSILKTDMDAIAEKLRPYITIPTDLLAKGSEGDNQWIMALAPVAPELMKILEITEEQIASALSPNEQQNDSDDGILLSAEEQEKLAKDIEKLSDDDKVTVLDIIATDENVEWTANGEDVQIELTNAKPSTFRKVVDCVAKLLQRQLSVQSSDGTEAPAAEPAEVKTKNPASTPGKRASTSSKPPAKRRQTEPHRRKAIDIEARKRELVEGIKKLGGTGTTRPIRRKVPYIPPSVGVRTSYRRSSSSSSETTTSTESWSSGSESEVDQE
ncbi:hypothetical protein OESDEN_11919 [Oesophagostomum dentatum]|uniref:NET domain-containing protein n=1 Tax=Oesophagostomum dentatum TaxID=61180 RepID=A0A0B1STK7_OESDE|nr:hypothetical protein OESDEN_11919 [Oesophagostomum dentatum]